MSDKSAIEWTDATWNPIRGCSRVSEGCRHCYAEGVAARFSGPGQPYEGLAKRVTRPDGSSEARWTGKLMQAPEETLTQPLRWKRPRTIFVNSMSDLFHEAVPDEWIDRIFAVMALCPQHVFQVLTKRPERMKAYLAPFNGRRADGLGTAVIELGYQGPLEALPWPLPNVWLGTSCEDQVTADTRIPYLLETPAAVRFISAEPLLGPVTFRWAHWQPLKSGGVTDELDGLRRLDWVIVGGESGPGARPMHPDWARSLRDQCAGAGVAFFFKQWGEWLDADQIADRMPAAAAYILRDGVRWEPPRPLSYVDAAFLAGVIGRRFEHQGDGRTLFRMGKYGSGRLLDGVTHGAFPQPSQEFA